MRETIITSIIVAIIVIAIIDICFVACFIMDKSKTEEFKQRIEILQQYNLINENDELLKLIMLKGEIIK